MLYFSLTILTISSIAIAYRVNLFFEPYGLFSYVLSLIVVSGLLYAGLTRNKQSIVFGSVALLLEVYSAGLPVIQYIKQNTAIITKELPKEPIKPERKTSVFWNTDQAFQREYREEMQLYRLKYNEYLAEKERITQYNLQKNRQKPDIWILTEKVLMALFSAIFLPLSLWAFSEPVKRFLDGNIKTEPAVMQIEKPIEVKPAQSTEGLYRVA